MTPQSKKVLKQIHFLISRTDLEKFSRYSYYSKESGIHLLIGTDNLGNVKIGVGFKNKPPPKLDNDELGLGHLPSHYIQSCITSGQQFKEFISAFNVFVVDYMKQEKTYTTDTKTAKIAKAELAELKGKEGVVSSLFGN